VAAGLSWPEHSGRVQTDDFVNQGYSYSTYVNFDDISEYAMVTIELEDLPNFGILSLRKGLLGKENIFVDRSLPCIDRPEFCVNLRESVR